MDTPQLIAAHVAAAVPRAPAAKNAKTPQPRQHKALAPALTTRCGLFVAAPSLVIEIDDVLDARIVWIGVSCRLYGDCIVW